MDDTGTLKLGLSSREISGYFHGRCQNGSSEGGKVECDCEVDVGDPRNDAGLGT